MKGDRFLIEEKCKELGFELLDKDFDYDKNRDSKFEVKCLNCGFISTKTFVTLVKNGNRCNHCFERNRDYHNSLEEILPKILKTCEECGYTFIGFEDGEWKKCRDSKLILKCNNCGKITYKNYDNFINKKSKCVCYRHQRTHDVNVLGFDKVMEKINTACKKHNFTFIQFLSSDKKYHNNKTVLELKCNKCGKILFYTFNHFTDRKNILCSNCNKSSLENQLKQKLIEEHINFEEQKKFDWLRLQSLDFYLPDFNIGIECQGIQHFKPVEYFGGKKAYDEQVERDNRKMRLCNENGVVLNYIINTDEINNIRNILK